MVAIGMAVIYIQHAWHASVPAARRYALRCRSMGKLVPAAILLVTAYQLLSDRNTLFGGPKPTVWSAPSTDGGGDGGGGDGSSTTAAMTVSSAPQGAGVPLVLPEGFKPVVAEPCRYSQSEH
jgi:hypothetical protein